MKRRGGLARKPYLPCAHRFDNVLSSLFPDVIEGGIDLAANLPVRIVGDADAARLGDSLKARCDIDTIAEDIVVVDDDIPDVNANAKFDPEFMRYAGVLFSHLALEFHRKARCIDRAGKLDQHAVASGLHDAAAVRSDPRIDKCLSKRL